MMREWNAYDMGINETRHDELARLQLDQDVVSLEKAMQLQGCVQLRADNVFLYPDYVSVWAYSYQTARQRLKGRQ